MRDIAGSDEWSRVRLSGARWYASGEEQGGAVRSGMVPGDVGLCVGTLRGVRVVRGGACLCRIMRDSAGWGLVLHGSAG